MEMAASFKRYSGIIGNVESNVTNAKPDVTDPFVATKLWSKIITYLKTNVNLKRRRYKIKHYDNCFTGEDAVNITYDCLLQERKICTLITNNVTRTSAVKVCQALLDNDVFRMVGQRTDRPIGIGNKFEDNSSKLYQFSDTFASPNDITLVDDDLRNCGITGRMDASASSDVENHFLTDTPKDLSHDSISIESDVENFGNRRLSQTFFRSFRLRKTLRVQKSTSSLDGANQSPLTQDNLTSRQQNQADDNNCSPNLVRFQRLESSCAVLNGLQTSLMDDDVNSTTDDEETVWKQVALSRLLALLDLPFLEDILPYSPAKSTAMKVSSTADNVPFPNHRLIAKLDLSPNKNDNPWVRASQEITESRCFLLDNPIGMSETELKIQAMDTVLRYYNSLPQLPIVPVNHNKIYVAVLSSIRSKKFSLAIHALQLSVLLLPWQQRKELHQLFKFMNLVAEDTTIQLQKEMSNRQYVLQSFTDVILRYDLLAQGHAMILLSFMLHNHANIFSQNDDVRKEVENRISDRKIRVSAPRQGFSYCQQVTTAEYEEQSKRTSEASLRDLMNSVVDSVAIPLKEKHKWLKKFKKTHSGVFRRYYHGNI